MRTDSDYSAPDPFIDTETPADLTDLPTDPQTPEDRLSRDETELYTNRELSWLMFNRRVLSEAASLDNPPLERLRFLSITASNLDEFFMVRFAALRARVLIGDTEKDYSGQTPVEQMRLIAEDARLLMDAQMEIYHSHIRTVLAELGLAPVAMAQATEPQRRWAESAFKKEIQPKLPPVQHHRKLPPVPQDKAVHLCMQLEETKGKDKSAKVSSYLATVMLPAAIQRVWKLPRALGGGILLLENIVQAFAGQLCPGARVVAAWPFRVTRDQDFTVPPNVTQDLVGETKKSLQQRKTGDIVRLEVDADAPDAFIHTLRDALRVPDEWVYRLAGPLNLTFLAKELCTADTPAELKYTPRQGRIPRELEEGMSVMDTLLRRDIFLHHPYDSFDVVLRFIREAASDPRVLAIKQTLYRVSGDSPIIKALCDAAEMGKRVTVLLEVKARFDEENNIRWGELLEKSGCTVLYGVPRVKTHSKITLVTRREEDGLRHYVHLGTGNYNDVTAKVYTDMGLLTSDPPMGEDAQTFFNMITGFSREPAMKRLVYAPKMLREELARLIEAETEAARAGRPSGIYAKMNSLVDPGLIHLLYDASRAGVPIRLMIRGVCCLRAGVPGLSETIEVKSLVGRFLEHSRAFRFENGGEPRYFLSSADWMPRNLGRRVELMFPVLDLRVQGRIQRVLDLQWEDTVKVWIMEGDGQYRRVPRGEEALNAQEMLFSAPT